MPGTEDQAAATPGNDHAAQLYAELVPVGRRIAAAARCPWYMDRSDLVSAVLYRLVLTVEGVEPVPPGLRIEAVAVRRMQEAVRRERDAQRRQAEWVHVLRTGADFRGRIRRHPAWKARRAKVATRPQNQPRTSRALIHQLARENPGMSKTALARQLGCSRQVVSQVLCAAERKTA